MKWILKLTLRYLTAEDFTQEETVGIGQAQNSTDEGIIR
jgi:hypothetical protein